MSVADRFKKSPGEQRYNTSGSKAEAKKLISLRRTTVWLPGFSGAVAIKIAHFKSGIFCQPRGVFGRRRTTTDRNEY